ncbi:MAG: response regulator transcription factor [Actinobacteria bacterium]|nr:response regulator transcription factor [Actinomycetota bacterium]
MTVSDTPAATKTTPPLRVVVVDDHPMWRDGVRTDLEADGRARVVGEAANADDAVEIVVREHPDLVLLDLNMPGLPGMVAIRRIAERLPGTRMLVLSASAAEPDVLEAVKAGASGYLLKSATGSDLVEAVHQVAAGEPVFSPSLAALVLGEFRRVAAGGGGDREQDLTERETEVLRLVAKGYTYAEIAHQLVISVRTVQNHVQHILGKLQLRGRYELMRYAIHRGLDRDDDR